MPSSHLILCRPLLLLPPIPPSIRVFSNESTLCMRWPKYWSFSFSISPSSEHPGQIPHKVTVAQACQTLSDPMAYTVHGILQARILEWVAFLFLLQGIFPTQGSNPSLLHFRQILYQLSHKGSPRTWKWVPYPFSKGIFQPRNQTRVSCIAGRFFMN